MNYLFHYELLIEKAQRRAAPEGYTERHHIIPKCMGGSNSNENIVLLTPEEHYVVHQLLVKIYPNVTGLVNAAMCMAANPHGKRGNKIYGWLRKQYSKTVSVQMSGKPKTMQHKEALSKALKGKIVSASARDNMSKAKLGKKQSPQMIANRTLKIRGKERSAEARESISAAMRLVWAKRKLEKQKGELTLHG